VVEEEVGVEEVAINLEFQDHSQTFQGLFKEAVASEAN
jgi:hypothetical protein